MTSARELGVFFALYAVLILLSIGVVLQWLPETATLLVLLVLLVLVSRCALAVVVTLVRLAPGYAHIYQAGAAARRRIPGGATCPGACTVVPDSL